MTFRQTQRAVRTPLTKEPIMVKKKSPTRLAGERESDLVLIADRYLHGATIQEMVDELNEIRPYQLRPHNIVNDINTIHKRWIASYLVDFDAAKAKELAHIDALEAEYWKAWRKSQDKTEQVDTEQTKDEVGGAEKELRPSYSRTKVRKSTRTTTGEPDYLRGIQWCIEQRCKIFGLLVSNQNINVTWRKQAELAGVDPDGVMDELVKQFVSAASMGGSGSTGSLD